MKVYTVHLEGEADLDYCGTKADAAASVKQQGKSRWPDITVSERDLATDKTGVLGILNGEPQFSEPTTIWGVTSRGALKEE